MADCAKRECSVEGCGRPSRKRGMCVLHARRKERGQALEAPLQYTRAVRIDDWQEVQGRIAPPELLAMVDEEAARRGVPRIEVLREAVREWCARHPPPPAPDWVAEAVEELREARRKVEASMRTSWATVRREGTAVNDQEGEVHVDAAWQAHERRET
ncbi:CopG family transcriptional regulator [Myxococcus sp. CA040A]|uniref:ribbon-helix-helix domain-containing protein n=1 Tax=Myxococcus sp. CA040A TaxID=2741738 RepID=UPI00157B5D56|nr:CopG family transcriptional regulator [Myxococcus sp. CA040A]NTX08294.1 ribbon-helix-helix protein, CopG family [Myxococcus sp. CA040A]